MFLINFIVGYVYTFIVTFMYEMATTQWSGENT